MIGLITNSLSKLQFFFEFIGVPSIGFRGWFQVLELSVKVFKVGVDHNDTIIKTDGKKLLNSFIHESNIQNKCLK